MKMSWTHGNQPSKPSEYLVAVTEGDYAPTVWIAIYTGKGDSLWEYANGMPIEPSTVVAWMNPPCPPERYAKSGKLAKKVGLGFTLHDDVLVGDSLGKVVAIMLGSTCPLGIAFRNGPTVDHWYPPSKVTRLLPTGRKSRKTHKD